MQYQSKLAGSCLCKTSKTKFYETTSRGGTSNFRQLVFKTIQKLLYVFAFDHLAVSKNIFDVFEKIFYI